MPGLRQRHAFIVDDVTARIPRVLIVAGLKSKGGVDDIAVDVIDLQPLAARVEGRLDALRPMIGVPQLGRHEQVLAPKLARLERILHRIADRRLVAIALGAIEMPESGLQCGTGRLPGHDWIGNERAESHRRNRPGPISGNSRVTK